MKKWSLVTLALTTLIGLSSCNKEEIQEFVRCDINNVHYNFTDVAEWRYQDSTGTHYLLAWCYKNSGDIDHDFMAVYFPGMAVGTYNLNPGPNGNPKGNGYCANFVNTAGQRCNLSSGVITVDAFEEETSIFDPFKRFHGNFHFTLTNTITLETVEVTNGEFNFSSWSE